MGAGSHPLVSIVLPTLNAGAGFKDLLGRLSAQRVEGDIELVVIDSGSADGTVAVARNAGANVLTIPRREFNHGGTRNQAIEVARGKYIALTVQDAIPTDDFWLARLMTPLVQQPGVAGSYGLQVAPPDLGLLARTRSWTWCQANRAPLIKALPGPGAFQSLPAEERLALVAFDNVTSCVRRSAWEQRPFPERGFAEDMAWAREVLLDGAQIAYVPTAQVWHGHERDWLYELRRSYIAGDARRELVDWPSSVWRYSNIRAALQRMVFFLRTDRFDGMQMPEEIERFLLAEMYHYEPHQDSLEIKTYLTILDYGLGLTKTALRFCPEGVFEEKAWIDLFRFAHVAVLGEALGAASLTGRREGPIGDRLAWSLLSLVLSKGV